MIWRGYDNRYGKCIGVVKRPDGWAWVMADGSKHFAGKADWICKTVVAAGFFINLLCKRSF